MIDKNMDKDLLKIINNYGISSQLKKLSEEVFELQEAIFKYEELKKWDDEYYSVDLKSAIEHLEEEFADCCVVLEQFKAYYNLDNDKIIEIIKQKIDRQLGRIEKEKNK